MSQVEAIRQLEAENRALQAKLAALENELCTAKDQIPPSMEGDSLSVALMKYRDKLAAALDFRERLRQGISEILSDEAFCAKLYSQSMEDAHACKASHRALQATVTMLDNDVAMLRRESAARQAKLAALEAERDELAALQAKNEGRIKYIVDEHLQQRITALEKVARLYLEHYKDGGASESLWDVIAEQAQLALRGTTLYDEAVELKKEIEG